MKTAVRVKDDTSLIHRASIDDACEAMGSRIGGLSSSEAQDKQDKYGKNVDSEQKGKPLILVFLSNFISMMAILLWVGGLVAFFADMPQLGIAVWLVNVINGVFSFWQEFRASKATEALKKMLSSFARVMRDGQVVQILTEGSADSFKCPFDYYQTRYDDFCTQWRYDDPKRRQCFGID